jgi:hypothetical protein
MASSQASQAELRGLGARALPRFVEPRRGLVKAMTRRAKNSPLGAIEILPEHVVLSCLARLPREDHDAVADCSVGFRALMRSERFVKARRAEDITEDTLVAVTSDGGLLALASGRVWRRLAQMPAEMRIDFDNNHINGIAATGSELFVISDLRSNGGLADVAVYDAIGDEWFTLPRPPLPGAGHMFMFHRFAVTCAGRIFVGTSDNRPVNNISAAGIPIYSIIFWAWDPDDQEWVNLPTMPPSMGFIYGNLVAVAVGSEIFICGRRLTHFSVFNVETETWRSVGVDITVNVPSVLQQPSLYVDGSLLHLLNHGSPTGDHYAYDTVYGWWVQIRGGLPRHTASIDSDRVLGIINHDGPDDYVFGPNETSRSSGSVRLYRRNIVHGHDEEGLASHLPVPYNAVRRVFSVAMP